MTERCADVAGLSATEGDAFFDKCFAEFKWHDAERARLLNTMAAMRERIALDPLRGGPSHTASCSDDPGEAECADIGGLVADFLDRADREDRILREWGYFDLQAQANHALECAGQIANRIFAVEATSPAAILVKVAVLRRALGRRGAQEDGDEELEAYQDVAPVMWLDSLEEDIARLAQRPAMPATSCRAGAARATAKE